MRGHFREFDDQLPARQARRLAQAFRLLWIPNAMVLEHPDEVVRTVVGASAFPSRRCENWGECLDRYAGYAT